MGTTLTGTTPQDTYDSLIKVTDNGPISGTLKALSDGLGNDSTLSLSTTAASIAGTLAVTGNAAFDTNVLFVDAASNEVGIGTASPQSIFHIGANAPANAGAKAYTGLANTAEGFLFDYYYDTTASNLRLFDVVPLGAATTGIGGSALRFLTVPQTTTNTPLERMRITSAGVVELAQGQIQFPSTQVASANANTLDDYEEGTFTATLVPSTSGSITLNGAFNTLSYTKIGRVVTVKGILLVDSVSSPVGVEVKISTLPFVPAAGQSNRGSGSIMYENISTFSQIANFNLFSDANWYIPINASTIVATNSFYVTLTYFA